MRFVLFLLLLGTLLGMNSCATDPCADKMCGSYAFCEDGDCKCDPGYTLNVNGLCVLDNRCVNGVCPTNFTCINGICEPITGPCANVVCGQDSVCINGNCIPTTGPCANVVCGQDSVCINGNCIPTTGPCANVVCGQDSVCVNGNCIPTTGPCANVVCGQDSVCINGNCIPTTGPCAYVVCGPDSVCMNGICVSTIPDPCAGINCGNGTCVSGTCICDPGYERDANGICNVAWSDKFEGSFLPTVDSCTAGSVNAGTFNYNTTINSLAADRIVTNNLFGFGTNNINIELTNSTEVSINYTDAAGRRYTGSGRKTGNILKLNTIIQYPNAGGSDTCVTTITY